MKYILLIFICTSGLTACRKSNNLRVLDNGTKLIAISSDSTGAWKFGYTGNFITSIRPDTDLVPYGNNQNAHYITIDSIQYITMNSIQYVTMSMVPDTFNPDTFNYVMSYTLTPSKLPLRIDGSYTSGGIAFKSNLAEFIYLKNTDLLDSVILNAGVNSLIIFKVTYNGQNITSVRESQVSNNESLVISTFNFNYGTTPNIFRHTDSLLYIYTYPQTALFAQSMVIATFFAETFSVSTFNGVTTSGITNGAWNQDSISSKMTYTLNADGKVTEEIFDNEIFEGLAGKKYYYQ